MDGSGYPFALATIVHALVLLGFGMRIVMTRMAPGSAFAWLLLIAFLPIVGVIMYLLMGERRIGPERARRIDSLVPSAVGSGANLPATMDTEVNWSRHPPVAEDLDRVGRALCGRATVRGSEITLFTDSDTVMAAIVGDIDDAEHGVTMAFYIWNEGGSADDVLEALIRAATRGVRCRVLVDALGGRPWLRGKQPERLRAAGVRVEQALPVGPLRSFLGRVGLRLHRKLVVVDDALAWTGSMNMADPRIFKATAGVGQWVDAMVRVRGSAVAPLGAVAFGDWMLETGEPVRETAESAGLLDALPRGAADIQVVPSGPGETDDGLLEMLLTLVNAARDELVLTTPYLVPDASMTRALRAAAARGVSVSIIVPERVDSILTRHASRSFFDDLLAAGVEIFLYQKGLLHTKSIVVDSALSMFGSVNLDMRSLWMNYEIALFVYDAGFATTLRALQQDYLAGSRRLDPASWAARAFHHRLVENTFRLVSPIL